MENIKATYEDLSDQTPEHLLAPIDREDFESKDVLQKFWREDGVLYLPKFFPEDLMNAYEAEWIKHNSDRPTGFKSPTPYVHVKEMRDLAMYKPLMEVMKHLIGEQMGLHLCLTGFVSTERDFHADRYLNPDDVGTHYIASWMALEDVHPDSGPFQFVRGSHKWPGITRERVFKYITRQEQEDPSWPSKTQHWVANACVEEMVKRDVSVETYLPKRGDLLLWHASLIHRGSPARVRGMQRKSLIAHYSALSKRPDMPDRRDHNGETYMWFDRPLE